MFTGLLVSLSSTAIVLKLLGDRSQMQHAATARSSLGVLLFQDLAIVLMVLIVPALGGAGRLAAASSSGRWPRPH